MTPPDNAPNRPPQPGPPPPTGPVAPTFGPLAPKNWTIPRTPEGWIDLTTPARVHSQEDDR